MPRYVKMVILLVFVLVLFNLLAYFYLNDFKIPDFGNGNINLKVFSFAKDLNNDPEVKGCFEAEDEWDCLFLLGLKRDDIDFCSLVEQDLYKARCYAYFAIARDDSKLCEEVTKLADNIDCFIYLALADKDVSQCGRDITNRSSAESCIKAVRQDYSNCDEDSALEEPCFLTAILTGDIDICYELDRSKRDFCLLTLTGDNTFCKTLNIYPENQSIGERLCRAVAAKNVSICQGIYDCGGISGIILFSELGKLRTNNRFG